MSRSTRAERCGEGTGLRDWGSDPGFSMSSEGS